MTDLDTVIAPGLTHWEASNRFFAYFKPHASYPAVLGELLCAGLNVMGFDWIASPAATELEVVCLDWLCKLLNLPERFLSSAPGPGGGVIQDSAGSSATVVLLAAVRRMQFPATTTSEGGEGGEGARSDETEEQRLPRSVMVVYGSDQTHTIVKKSCMILGVRFRALPTKSEDSWALQADVLRETIQNDVAMGLVPIACVATAGTTSSCAFDAIHDIAQVCAAGTAEHGALWLHIDAAYVILASVCLPLRIPPSHPLGLILLMGVVLADTEELTPVFLSWPLCFKACSTLRWTHSV